MKNDKKQENRRYKISSCRDKRSIVRALNTFSKQYEYILCNEKDIDLNIKPMTLIYEDNIDDDKESIIYSQSLSDIELQDTKIILNTIDNLISINRKEDIKQELKDAVLKRQYNDNKYSNPFFKSELISLSQIENIVDNEKFAKRIYNQIKNRIMFKRSGIYTTNYNESTVKNRIKTSPIALEIIVKKKFEFVIANLWLFSSDIVSRVNEVNNTIDKDRLNKNFNIEYTQDNNSTFFHPIDEESYNDSSNHNETKRSSMTLQMIDQEENGLYDKDIYSDYYSLVENYEDNIAVMYEYIEELVHYVDIDISIKEQLDDKDLIEQLNEYINTTIEYKVNELRYFFLSGDFEIEELDAYILVRPPITEIKKYIKRFYEILDIPYSEHITITFDEFVKYCELQYQAKKISNVDPLSDIKDISFEDFKNILIYLDEYEDDIITKDIYDFDIDNEIYSDFKTKYDDTVPF